ncbi:MAG: PTS sugar transporter subunit IIA [Alphaproteobacteria bacterium]
MILNSVEFDRDIELDVITPALKAENKGDLLAKISKLAADQCRLDQNSVREYLDILLNKDNVSPGGGILIPAMTLKQLHNPATILVTLQKPVALDTIDAKPIDIVCLVLSPDHEKPHHLRRLSRISRLLKNKVLVQKIRETTDSETIRALIHNPDGWMMAA